MANIKEQDPVLARNLQAVCRGLTRAVVSAAKSCRQIIDFDFPETLLEVAVDAGWMEPPLELEERDLDGKGILLGHTLIVEEEFRDWFLSHCANALQATDKQLEEIAAAYPNVQWQQFVSSGFLFDLTGLRPNDDKWLNADFDLLKKTVQKRLENSADNSSDTPSDNPAKAKIDEYFYKLQMDVNLQFLASKASEKKLDGKTYAISRTTVSNIYNGFGANSVNREAVANVISELVRCTRDDLKGTKKRPKESPKPKSKAGK